MLNHDEPILRSRTIDPAAPFPIVHQAIRIALYEEFAARSFDARVVEAFGPRAPFPELVRADEQRIAALSGLCQRFGIPRPLDPFPQETRLEPSWLATCARAVAGRIATAQRYGALLARVAEPEVRNVFLQLQSTSTGSTCRRCARRWPTPWRGNAITPRAVFRLSRRMRATARCPISWRRPSRRSAPRRGRSACSVPCCAMPIPRCWQAWSPARQAST